MEIKEFLLRLKQRNANLKDFEIDWICPMIEIREGKEVVTEIEFKLKRKEEEYFE